MIAMPQDNGRAVIPAVECVARVARIAFELLRSRFPLVERDRRDNGRRLEGDFPPGLLLAVQIGPLGSAQFILVRLADLEFAPLTVAPVVASLKAPVVRELHQVA